VRNKPPLECLFSLNAMTGGKLSDRDFILPPSQKGMAVFRTLDWLQLARTCAYLVLWMTTSVGVILYNAWLLKKWTYSITLTLWHMFFCSSVSFVLVYSGVVENVTISRNIFVSRVLPIGAFTTILEVHSLCTNKSAQALYSLCLCGLVMQRTPLSLYLSYRCSNHSEQYTCMPAVRLGYVFVFARSSMH